MAHGLLKGGNLTKETLLGLAAIGVIMIAPNAGFMLQGIAREYFGDKSKKTAIARARKLRELRKKELIKFTELGNGTVRIELTDRGKNAVRVYNIDKIQLNKPKYWDERWRILIYDIPLSRKKAAEAFRYKMKQLGLFPLQKSVWVSPYECLSEIEFLAAVFELQVGKHILYFTSKEIPRQEEVKKFFELS